MKKTKLDELYKDKKFTLEWYSLSTFYDAANILLSYRKICGLTQKELADKAGVTVDVVAGIENVSEDKFTVRNVVDVANAMSLRVRIDFTLVNCDDEE